METQTAIYLIVFVLIVIALGAWNAYRVSKKNGEMQRRNSNNKHKKAPRKW